MVGIANEDGAARVGRVALATEADAVALGEVIALDAVRGLLT